MKRLKINLLMGIILLLASLACRENKPRGHEMSWSPAGDRLAFVSFEANELLVAEFNGETLTKMTAVDTCQREKNHFLAPCWSPDGKYLLYSKVDSSQAQIRLFDWQQKNNTLLCSVLNFGKKNGLIVPPVWSPVANRILWGQSSAPNKVELQVTQGNSFGVRSITLSGQSLQAEWSADGQSIFYLVTGGPHPLEKGLWKMNVFDFSKGKISGSPNFVQFAISRSNTIAIIEQISLNKTDRFRISLIDSSGKLYPSIQEERAKITNICWSDDGTRLAWLREEDSTANIWQWDTVSRRSVRLTFDDAKELIGWSADGELFYTVKSPEFLLKSNPDFAEFREFSHALQGRRFDNQLIQLGNSGRRILERNVAVFTPFAFGQQAAFYRIAQTIDLQPEIYCPVITFPGNKSVFLAVAPAEHSVAADWFFQNGKYAAALEHLNAILPDFAAIDSSNRAAVMQQMKSGNFTRKYLVLRKLGQNKNAEFLFQQFVETYFNQIAKDEKNDNFLWSIIGVYSELDEMKTGISDLEEFLKSEQADSSFKGHILFTQAILAAELRNWSLSLEKLNRAIHTMPVSFTDWDDLQSLLSILVALDQKLSFGQVEPVLEHLLRRMATDKEKAKFYEMAGDYYRKQGKISEALAAYRKIALNQNEIWQKILDLETK